MNEIDKYFIFGIVVIVIVIFSLVKINSAKEPSKENMSAFDKEVVLRQLFMESCTQNMSRTQCRCMYNYILTETGYEGMVTLAEDYKKTGKMPDIYKKAVVECINK